MEIRRINTQNSHELEWVFPVMQQLRPHLDLEKFRALIAQMMGENYELWAAVEDEQLLGLVSTRVYTDFVRGPHIYIDDLITDEVARSRGVGARLLAHVEGLARKHGFAMLRLSCVTENTGGLKFYRREGWQERAFALVKKIKP